MSSTPAMRSLWKGVDMATTLSVPGRHTDWTCTPCWIAHASIVPIATHKKLLPQKSQRKTLVKLLDGARLHRPCHVARGDFVNGLDGTPVTALTLPSAWSSGRPADRERVLLGVQSGWFRALNLLVNEGCRGQWEHRFDPYTGFVSWWRIGVPNPYPVALLAGYLDRPVTA